MPVYRCSNGKYRIGNGPCMYKSKKEANIKLNKADKAYAAYRAQRATKTQEFSDKYGLNT